MTNYVIQGRNVNQIWARAVPLVQQIGQRQDSRAGPVLVAPHPVMSAISSPTERVLFDPMRDANPFFHFFECLWMLAGRRDTGFLDEFVKNFGERFGEASGVMYGAYGYRWRCEFDDRDQLDIVVRRLSENPDDRRVVIAMWHPTLDLWDPEERHAEDKMKEPKDLPCNTHIYPRLRPLTDVEKRAKLEGMGVREDPAAERNLDGSDYHLMDAVDDERVLDLTVCCRSNDIVWGAYGANAVHFSFLQEYLAARLGARVGSLYQLSNNWHAYVNVLEAYKKKQGDDPALAAHRDWYVNGTVQPVPIASAPNKWDQDLGHFMGWMAGGPEREYANDWFPGTAAAMWHGHRLWRLGKHDLAVHAMDDVAASDWARAGREWMMRRAK